MNKRETVQAFVDSIQQGEFENAKSMLADDFHYRDAVSEPINTEAWLGMSANLKTAFPDLDYHFKVIGTEGDVVKTTMQLSGTHSGSFDLTDRNMGVIAATNNAFSVKREKAKLTVKGTKITAWVIEQTEGAGLKAILDQLRGKPAIL
jgi:predicted ester cyclase